MSSERPSARAARRAARWAMDLSAGNRMRPASPIAVEIVRCIERYGFEGFGAAGGGAIEVLEATTEQTLELRRVILGRRRQGELDGRDQLLLPERLGDVVVEALGDEALLVAGEGVGG